ncbi:MAG TPA: S-methyl-5-thioribose-1-phosphate isomerase [Candidatus Acidoferrales bacterium]
MLTTMTQPIEWTNAGVRMLDQRRLPAEVVYHTYTHYREVAQAIKEMVIRGAPAIGIAAAMGVALGVETSPAQDLAQLENEFAAISKVMAETRPTAVNLFWAIERMKRRFAELKAAQGTPEEKLAAIRRGLVEEAKRIHAEERALEEAMARHGAPLMPQSGVVLTQCNTGPLATGGIGTALGIILTAVAEGKQLRVLVPETRPYLQGARLTAWELKQAGVPQTLITDNMIGHFMRTGQVGCVITGADRIAANGDTANKIGTYPMAVLAREHGVPFYVAAPLSTLDPSIPSGDQIPIEQRAAREVTHIRDVPIAPEGVPAANPAFDITPARFIAAVITERGVARAPYEKSLRKLLESTA